MAQNGSMARRIKVLVDGAELHGLVKFGEVALEASTIDVPTFQRIIKIQSGVIKMPEITLGFETRRNTQTRRFLRNWWNTKGAKQFTIVAYDADGVEFERMLWADVEIRRLSEPDVDFANPSYARIDITVLPYDITQAA